MSLVRFLGGDYGPLAERVALMHLAILDNHNPNNRALETFIASGVTYDESSAEMFQTLFVWNEAVELSEGIHTLVEHRNLLSLVRNTIGAQPDWLVEIRVHVVPAPEHEVSLGDGIVSANRGTAGPAMLWNGGSGFLTAGHVAPVGTRVTLVGNTFSRSTQIGTVKYCGYKTNTGTSTIADVSVVELNRTHSPPSPLGNAGSAAPAQRVTVHNSPSGTSARIMGYLTYVHWPRTNATYGNCYITTSHVTQSGDSGSAVSGGNSVVGMVVGGSPNVTTYIQDINFLISAVPQNASGLLGLAVR